MADRKRSKSRRPSLRNSRIQEHVEIKAYNKSKESIYPRDKSWDIAKQQLKRSSGRSNKSIKVSRCESFRPSDSSTTWLMNDNITEVNSDPGHSLTRHREIYDPSEDDSPANRSSAGSLNFRRGGIAQKDRNIALPKRALSSASQHLNASRNVFTRRKEFRMNTKNMARSIPTQQSPAPKSARATNSLARDKSRHHPKYSKHHGRAPSSSGNAVKKVSPLIPVAHSSCGVCAHYASTNESDEDYDQPSLFISKIKPPFDVDSMLDESLSSCTPTTQEDATYDSFHCRPGSRGRSANHTPTETLRDTSTQRVYERQQIRYELVQHQFAYNNGTPMTTCNAPGCVDQTAQTDIPNVTYYILQDAGCDGDSGGETPLITVHSSENRALARIRETALTIRRHLPERRNEMPIVETLCFVIIVAVLIVMWMLAIVCDMNKLLQRPLEIFSHIHR